MAWTSLCDLAELTDGQGKFVQISGFELAVYLHDGKVFALDNTCPHAGGPLWEGTIDGDYCVCPWHNWAFGLETGELRGAAGIKITSYPTRILEREGKETLVQADLPFP